MSSFKVSDKAISYLGWDRGVQKAKDLGLKGLVRELQLMNEKKIYEFNHDGVITRILRYDSLNKRVSMTYEKGEDSIYTRKFFSKNGTPTVIEKTRFDENNVEIIISTESIRKDLMKSLKDKPKLLKIFSGFNVISTHVQDDENRIEIVKEYSSENGNFVEERRVQYDEGGLPISISYFKEGQIMNERILFEYANGLLLKKIHLEENGDTSIIRDMIKMKIAVFIIESFLMVEQ